VTKSSSNAARSGRGCLGRLPRLLIVGGVGLLLCCVQPARGEEPYERFIGRLKDERLYDLALEYLADLEERKAADATFLAALPLERALLMQQAASAMSPRNPQREARLDAAKVAFDDFLRANKEHPRRSEARMGLGNLLLSRADEAQKAAGPDAASPAAAKFYGEARQLFEAANAELAELLTSMKGERIDPADSAKVALRERYRGDYRQSQLFVAFSTENEGRSYAANSPQWKSGLEKALELYNKLYLAETERIEVRNYALFYRSGIYRDLGKLDDAIDSLQRIVDHEGTDLLRPLQVQALTEMIKLLCREDQAKYPVAVERGERWVKQVRPDERNRPEVLACKVELASAKIALAKANQAKGGDEKLTSRLQKEARTELQQLVRAPGSHQDQARGLLAAMGVEKTDAVASTATLPAVKNFSEAMQAAREKLEQSQTESLAVEVQREQLAGLPEDQQATLQADIERLEKNIADTRTAAIELLRRAMKLYKAEDGLDKLTDARYQLALLHLQTDQAWEAIAIGDFLARTNAGSPVGLQCATVALSAYGKLIAVADEQERLEVAAQLEPFAEFMVTAWPDSSEAQAAAGALVQLSLVAGEFDRAESYLQKLPADAPAGAKLRRETGLQLAARYFRGRAGLGADEPVPETLLALRGRAVAMLSAGLEGLTADQLDRISIEATNALIRMLLAEGKSAEAARWASRPELSAIAALRSRPELVEDRLVKLDTYRTALQASVAQLGQGGDAAEVLRQLNTIVDEMRNAAGTDEEGRKLLAGIFVAIARDLQELVESAGSAESKEKLASGLGVLAGDVGKNAQDFATRLWSAQTLTKVAEALGPRADSRQQLLADASDVLDSILAREAQSPGWIQPATSQLLVVKQLAGVHRLRGNYQESIEKYKEVLQANNAMVDVQEEAARTLQAWGDSGAKGKHELAMLGDGVDAKSRGKIIWGWGKLSQVLAGKPQFDKLFFDARYELSVCMYKTGLAQTDAAKKKQYLEKAKTELERTALLYPELGGAENKKRYENLLRLLQKELGQPEKGFAK
jgi:hypothetical protein